MANWLTSTRGRRYLLDFQGRLMVVLAMSVQLPTANTAFAQEHVAGHPDASVRLFVDRSVNGIDTDRVLRVSEHLLAATGVRVEWRDCVRETTCPQPTGGGFHVAVFVRPAAASPAAGRCGVGTRDPKGAGGAVLVYHDCVADVVHRLRTTPLGRTSPLVASVDESDLIGLAIAHEIGHLAGLGHARTGVMRARVDAEDILSLRQQSLTFATREAAILRRAMAAPDAPTLASTAVR